MFENYLTSYNKKLCPRTITYIDGQVHCNTHSVEERDEDDDSSEPVPFL